MRVTLQRPRNAHGLVDESCSRCFSRAVSLPQAQRSLSFPAQLDRRTGLRSSRQRTPRLSKTLMSAAVDMQIAPEPAVETDANGRSRLKFQREGWNYWMWRGSRIHYIQAGSLAKPPVILVHGFGASAYHWRYVIPELAKKYSVFAVDLLGFGLSEKPSVVYNGYSIWSEQLRDFVQEIVGGRAAVLVGNSMGAYASLLTSAYYPDVSRGLVLVNGAGRFEEVKAAIEAGAEAAVESGLAKEAVREVPTSTSSHFIK